LKHGVIDTTAFGAAFVDVAFQADGKILALGRKLVRFNADGTLDNTFGGGDGIVDVSGKKLIVDANGNINVLGYFALFRYTNTGTLDTSFDGDGVRPSVKGSDFALAPDGDLIVIGNGGNNDQMSRFNSNGSIDDAFGNHGNLFVPAGWSAAVTANDIYVGGTGGDASLIPFNDFEIRAYTQAGKADTAFGNGGRVVTDFDLSRDTLVGVAIQEGKLLAMGYADVRLDDTFSNTQSEPALARYQISDAVPPPGQTPFNGTPINITDGVATVQFDKGGEGVAYHDTEAANLGGAFRPDEGVDIQYTGDAFHPNIVSFVKPGEWLEYTMDFTQSGPFNLNIRAASLFQSGTFRVLVDGQSVGTFSTADTGGWQTYKTLSQTGINVSQGQHVVRFQMDTAGKTGYTVNLNWFQFQKA
jgi:uncharacterized delta-60 repeat protein